ncbi:hypothetical protein DSQ19_07300 [Candidatus Nitrosotenuis sp. DW1]|nr:hypothetical protein DSQ19_07300 [Candidatus Nitrosotenuis sp. DW1]
MIELLLLKILNPDATNFKKEKALTKNDFIFMFDIIVITIPIPKIKNSIRFCKKNNAHIRINNPKINPSHLFIIYNKNGLKR